MVLFSSLSVVSGSSLAKLAVCAYLFISITHTPTSSCPFSPFLSFIYWPSISLLSSFSIRPLSLSLSLFLALSLSPYISISIL